jgi:hypothetical protein
MTGGREMKRFIGQILTLGAYDDWQALPVRDKIILPLAYIAMLVGYYALSVYLN